jgi:hypothetical protein
MRRILLFIFIFVGTLTFAAPVDKSEAQQKAVRFMTAKTGIQKKAKATNSGVRRAAAQQEPFYVFNLEGGGYVIVSGDDRTEEILGYSTTAIFDPAQIPDNMKALLQEYADGIQYLNEHGIQPASHAVRRAAGDPIEPFVKTRWSQGNPYNLLCPTVSGERTVTGCVATAMAQAMAYYSWPAVTSAEIPAYQTRTRRLVISKVDQGTAIDWNNMIDSYYGSGSYTTAQGNAVAQLMMMCGRSVNMDYDLAKNGGSGANGASVANALVKYFNYEEETCRYLYRSDYNYEQWRDVLYAELEAKRPVMYNARTTDSGHMFIIDGYDTDDFFHINWGWAGNSDNYYRLTLLKPTDVGTGGSADESGYIVGHGMVVGVKPNDEVVKEMPLQLTIDELTSTNTTFTRSSTTQNFAYPAIQYAIYNETADEVTADVGIRIVDSEGNLVQELATAQTNKTIKPNYGFRAYTLPSFGANYADGDYQLVFVSKKSGTEKWTECLHSDKHYMKFNIKGNTMTVSFPVYSLSLTNVEIVGTGVAYTEHTLKATIKNNGENYSSDVWFYLNPSDETNVTKESEDKQAIGVFDFESGKDVSVEIKFVPTKNGLNKIYLVDDNGVIDHAIELQLTGGIDIRNTAYASEGAILHHDADKNVDYIYSKTTTFKVTVENQGEKAFSGTVYMLLYGLSGNTYYELERTSKTVSSLGAGESTVCSHNFNAGKWSGFKTCKYILYYMESGKTKAIRIGQTNVFEIREIPVKLNLKNSQIEHSNTTDGTIEGNEFMLSSVLENTGEVAFNGNISVRVWEFLPSTDAKTSTDYLVPFELEAGASKQFDYSFTNPAKEEGAKYSIEVFYTYDEEVVALHQTAEYSFLVGDSGIEELTSHDQRFSGKVYDLQGRRVGEASDFNMLKPGVYIIGGKKIVKK